MIDLVGDVQVVLSLLSEYFRNMFSATWREASSREITFTDFWYSLFIRMMEYLYTGTDPDIEIVPQEPNSLNEGDSIALVVVVVVVLIWLFSVVELLHMSDRFMLDHLKQVCEQKLAAIVCADTGTHRPLGLW